MIVDRHAAGVLNARRDARPAAVGNLVLNDGTFGQLRGIDKVLLAVVLVGVALNSQGGDFNRTRLMAAYRTRTVLGAGLGNRRQLVGRPAVRMLGVHLNCEGLLITGSIRSNNYMLGTGIAFGSLNRIPAVLISLELHTVIGDCHRLVTIIEHVKRNALAIGSAILQVIKDGLIGIHIGIRLFIPLAIANPANLLTNTVGLRRGGRNDLVFPPAGLALQHRRLVVLADLYMATFAIRLPGSVVGNSMGTLLDLDLSIGRRIVVVVLGIADVVRSRQKIG